MKRVQLGMPICSGLSNEAIANILVVEWFLRYDFPKLYGRYYIHLNSFNIIIRNHLTKIFDGHIIIYYIIQYYNYNYTPSSV